MNAGFSSLAELKAAVVAAALRTRTDFDAALVSLGLGAASMIEAHLNRSLAWSASATHDTSARLLVLSLPKYPLASVASVQIKGAPGDSFSTVSDLIQMIDLKSGLLHFMGCPGAETDTLRVTYAGGYFWDVTEDSSGTLPEGATLLPAVIRAAWLLQVQAMLEATNLFGAQSSTKKGKEGAALAELDVLPIVQTMLRPFRRMI